MANPLEPTTDTPIERLKGLLPEWERLENAFHDAVPDQGDPGDGGVAGRALCQFLYDHSETIRATIEHLPSAGERERLRAALRLIAETEQWEDAGPSGHAKTPGALRDFAQNVLDGFDPREALATLDRARGVRP
jgi:hypothetical protein